MLASYDESFLERRLLFPRGGYKRRVGNERLLLDGVAAINPEAIYVGCTVLQYPLILLLVFSCHVVILTWGSCLLIHF